MRHMSEYRGWAIAVTPSEEAPMLWRGVIEVWPPGSSRTDDPRVVSFARSAVSQDEILKVATRHIEEWIRIARADDEQENP
jgi:hypothetical protein